MLLAISEMKAPARRRWSASGNRGRASSGRSPPQGQIAAALGVIWPKRKYGNFGIYHRLRNCRVRCSRRCNCTACKPHRAIIRQRRIEFAIRRTKTRADHTGIRPSGRVGLSQRMQKWNQKQQKSKQNPGLSRLTAHREQRGSCHLRHNDMFSGLGARSPADLMSQDQWRDLRLEVRRTWRSPARPARRNQRR